MNAPLYLPLAETGHLTFCPHHTADTATFDVAGRSVVPDRRIPPNFEYRGWTGLCCNITRAQARTLRDALTEWLSS